MQSRKPLLLGALLLAAIAAIAVYLSVGSRLSAPALRPVGPPPASLHAETVHIPSESRDAVAAVDYLHQRLPGLPVGGVGTSLGGAAFLLAADSLVIDALVVESVYPTIEEAVSNRIDRLPGSGRLRRPGKQPSSRSSVNT